MKNSNTKKGMAVNTNKIPIVITSRILKNCKSFTSLIESAKIVYAGSYSEKNMNNTVRIPMYQIKTFLETFSS